MFDIFISSQNFDSKIPEIDYFINKYELNFRIADYNVKKNMNKFLNDALDCKVLLAGTEDLSELCSQSNSLIGISRLGAGLDNIPLALCKKKGIKVVNIPNVQTKSVAQFTIGLIINSLRNISSSNLDFRDRIWEKKLGYDFEETTVGIIGFGKIGSQVGKYLDLLGFKQILAYDPFISRNLIGQTKEVSDKIHFVDKYFLASNSDIVTLHCDYTKDTKKIIDKDFLDAMVKNSSIINTSRSGLIDLAYLYSILDFKFNQVALDVHETEPYSRDAHIHNKIIGTPHIASFSRKTREMMYSESFKNALDILLESGHVSEEVN
jgi:D-3-phosphoglycerate dehydrogenase